MLFILLELLHKYNVFGLISFMLPFALFCYHAMKLKKKKTDDLRSEAERMTNVDSKQPPDSDTNSASESEEEVAVEEGEKCVNLTKANYLNMDWETGKSVTEVLAEPPVDLDRHFANFLQAEDAIVYSRNFNIVVSCMKICKPTDVVFCDEFINTAVQQALNQAKTRIIYFSHNNVNDFSAKITQASQEETKDHKPRLFLILEGIFEKTGKVCDLKNFVKTAEACRVRIILDETLSFGVLGPRGLGVVEHANVHVNQIDLLIVNLQNTIEFLGGFCAGSNAIIEQQRTWSHTSMYSSSKRPQTSQIALKALATIEETTLNIQKLAKRVHRCLSDIEMFEVISDDVSPMKVFKIAIDSTRENYNKTVKVFCKDQSVYVTLNADTNTLVLHLNAVLYHDELKVVHMLNVLKNAAAFCIEKEQLMQIL